MEEGKRRGMRDGGGRERRRDKECNWSVKNKTGVMMCKMYRSLYGLEWTYSASRG